MNSAENKSEGKDEGVGTSEKESEPKREYSDGQGGKRYQKTNCYSKSCSTRLKRAHGQQTDDEREASLKREREKQQEEEDKLMAVSLMAEGEAAKKKAEDERFEKEYLSPVQGVLCHTQYETTSYRQPLFYIYHVFVLLGFIYNLYIIYIKRQSLSCLQVTHSLLLL